MKIKICEICIKEIPVKEFSKHRKTHICSMLDISDAIREFAESKNDISNRR